VNPASELRVFDGRRFLHWREKRPARAVLQKRGAPVVEAALARRVLGKNL